MPVHPQDGGYQWGSSGKIYRGKGAKKKAEKQAAAAYAHGYTGDSVGHGMTIRNLVQELKGVVETNDDGVSHMCDQGHHERCKDKDCQCWCHDPSRKPKKSMSPIYVKTVPKPRPR